MTITKIDRKRDRASNSKPAPACITPDLVARILDLVPPRATAEPSATLIPFPTRPSGPEAELAASAISGELVLLAGRGSKNDRHENWRPEEDERLRRAYANGERVDLVAKELGRTECAARTRAGKIGLAGTHPSHGGWCTEPAWTDDEDRSLREGYGKMPTQALADQLGRSKGGIYQRAFRLGLDHGFHRPWSDDELRALDLAFQHGVAIADLSLALDRKPFSVSKYATKHGFDFGRRKRLAAAPTLADILALGDGIVLPRRSSPAKTAKRSASFWMPKTGRKPAKQRPAKKARPAPARVSAWDDDRKAKFLGALAATGTVGDALESVGLRRNSAHGALAARRADPDFAARWEAVVARVKRARAAASEAKRAAERAAERAARATRRGVAARDPQIEAALRAQAARKRNATLAAGPRLTSTTQGAAAFMAQRHQDEINERNRRLANPVEQAKIYLQRKGRIVYRASVAGGAEDRWFVSGCGADVTDQALIELAVQRGLTA